MDYNCLDCLYAENIENGVKCTLHKYTRDGEVILSNEKAKVVCTNHSHKLIEETRYMRDNSCRNMSEDNCQICFRPMDIMKKDDYIRVNTKNIPRANGKNIICVECGKKLVEEGVWDNGEI